MPSNYDRDKYKAIFEKRYGKGSYDTGLSSAKNIGETKAQASFAKEEYKKRLQEAQDRAKNKTYDDAISYWSQPENSAVLRKEGASRKAENIRNDPRLKAQIQEQGFKVDDYVDAMYYAASNGKFRSEREFKGYSDQLKKDTTAEQTARDKEYKQKYGMGYQEYSDFQKTVTPPKVKKSENKNSLLDDILTPLKRFGQAVNPFDDVSIKEAIKGNVNDALSTERSAPVQGIKPFTDEVGRLGSRAANTASLGTLKNLAKKTDATRADEMVFNKREGAGAVADFGYDALGYLVPGTGAYKAVRSVGAGLKPGAKGLTKVRQLAQEGAIAGGALGAGEVYVREGLNPQDTNFKDNLKHIGLGVGLGAVADPALYGVGKALKGALNKSKPTVEPPLGLPEPQRRLVEPPRALPEPKEITSQPNTQPFEFREPKFINREVAASSEAINPLPKLKQGRDFEPITAAEEPPLLRADDPIQDMSFNPKNMKDISGVKAATSDVYRIFRDAFGKDFEKAGKPVLDKLDSAKKNYVGMQENWAKKLKTEVVDKLGIKKGSKESALVQRFGEKNMTLAELKQASPDKWKDIVKADQWFRQAYDEMYSSVNKARKEAYPNSPDKQVPKLDNYYRHFREMNGLTGLKNIFDSPSQIDPHLAGMSQHTNPSSKWHSFMQKRGMGPYKEDAVGGFLEYIPGASYASNIDPVIPVFKNLRRQLADGMDGDGSNNNFLEFLYNYSNDLAGKTNPYFDRNLQQLVGRKTMSVLNWVNNRVKKNVILGNIGSTLAQMANVPNGIAFAKQHSVKGAQRTLSAVFDKNAPIHKSEFLKERYLGKLFREFDQRLIDQPEKLAGWMIETSDRIGSSFVWNSAYEKGLKQGVKNPIKYADDNTRKLIAGRGVGEVPLLQKAKTTQLVMPFTLEVANLWRVMGDFAKTKDFGAIATLFVGNYLLNKGMEETRGSAVTFDPIDAILDAFADEEISGAEKSGRLLGEVLTNVPLGQHIAGLYPEDGKVANIKGPTREKLFGDRNPQRFGTGLVAANGLSDLAFKFALPFGGNQLKKTLSGIEGLQNKGSYTKEGSIQLPFVGENQKLRYPIDPTPWNSTKAALFGQSATSEAQEYYDMERRPLSENQTFEYDLAKQSGFGKEFYESLMKQRLSKTTQKKIKEIAEDQNLTQEEKQGQILILLEKLNSPK
ncbi:hypothetical protein [Cytobacillus oceanisediminis]|uniref:hypothetical protein n=1 Tax=Cytobacillus oceanisediminis TaxID=665099 RepID=UPI003734EA9F